MTRSGPTDGGRSVPAGSEDKPLELQIEDAAGRIVRRLAVSGSSAAARQIFWDGLDEAGRPASSGMYFCRLLGPSGRAVREILVIR